MSDFNLDLLQSSKLPPTWPRGLLIFTVVIFLITVSIGAGLKYFWLAQQQSKLESLEKKFEELRSNFPLEKEKEIMRLEKKLKVLEYLLNNHISFTNLMETMESLTHPDIYYRNWSYDKQKNSLVVEGIAKNQEILSQAINGLIDHPQEVKVVMINDATNVDNTTVFHLEIIFQPNVGKLQTSVSSNNQNSF